MKLYMKLGIFVLVLFALVIATCLLWKPVKMRYYVGKLRSENPKEWVAAVDSLLEMGNKGIDALAGELDDDRDSTELLMKYWGNINETITKEGYKYRPLHVAARKGYKRVVEILIAKGADVNFYDSADNTPLHTAAYWGYTDIARLLIENGSEVNAKNKAGEAPLHRAAYSGHKNTVALLIKKGADVNAKGEREETPLHRAMWNGRKDVAIFLINEGADVNSREQTGLTPLQWAAIYNHKDVIELLIAKKADVNTRDMYGNTPLDRAIGNGYKEISDLFRGHGGKTGKEIREQENKETRKK